MRASDFIVEQPTTTTTPQGVATTVNKAANRVTTRSDMGTMVKDRSGRVRSVQTPKIGGLQAKQTFRPDGTKGYQQVDYDSGTAKLSAKGSPETGYSTTAQTNFAGIGAKVTDKTARGGGKQMDLKYQVSPTKTLKTTVPLKQSQFEDVQNAIREHVKQGIPFTECMFRAGSPAFTEFYRQVREVADKLNLDWQDQELLTTDIGECIVVEDELVPLDVPMELDEATSDFDGELEDLFAELEEAKGETSAVAIEVIPNKLHGADDNTSIITHALNTVNGAGNRTKEKKVLTYKRKINGKDYTVFDGLSSSIEQVKKELKKYGNGVKMIAIGSKTKPSPTPSNAVVMEAEYNGKKVKLNSPKRGGPKKFYVYVKNPKTGRVKKISWGDTTGLSVKAKDRGAVRSFVARHKCKQANDKMTARYWSCRTPRYKALGVKGGQWW